MKNDMTSKFKEPLPMYKLYERTRKIFHGKNTYAQLSVRQARRIIRLVKRQYGNVSMMDFHVALENILSSDLPF